VGLETLLPFLERIMTQQRSFDGGMSSTLLSRLSSIDDRLSRVEQRLARIERSLGMRPVSGSGDDGADQPPPLPPGGVPGKFKLANAVAAFQQHKENLTNLAAEAEQLKKSYNALDDASKNTPEGKMLKQLIDNYDSLLKPPGR
jgi:hypothetical protein